MNTRRKVQSSKFLGFDDQDHIVAETFFESFETEENEENEESDCDSSHSTTMEKSDSYASDTFKNSTLDCTSSASPITKISDSTEDINLSNCPICLQVYQERCYLYPCYHTFCISCIRQWLNVTPDCPLCKFRVEFLITDVDDSKGTFTKLYIDDTMEDNIRSKMKRQKWISEISNITERNSDLKSIRNKVYSENLLPINVPNSRSKEIFTFNKYDIERIRPFITRDLIALLPDTYDVVVDEHVFSVILSFYKQKKTKNEIIETLKPWLGKSTEEFIHEVTRFTESELSIDTWDKSVSYA